MTIKSNVKMNSKKDQKRFWNRYAWLYDFEIKQFNGHAYGDMCRMMGSALASDMDVLEVATGTGLIAIGIAAEVRSVTATDFAPKMIATAQKKKAPSNVTFAVADATALSFRDESFDAVVISNALHIMPDPIRVLSEISRVLKGNGLLIAPNYVHGLVRASAWNINAAILKCIGFETYAKWTPEMYVDFITSNGFTVGKTAMLEAAFPLIYLEARKNEKNGSYSKLICPSTVSGAASPK